MFDDLEARVDRVVEALLKGRRIRVSARDAGERETIMVAAELAAAREGHPRMSPAFRRQLGRLLAGEDRALVTRRTALGAAAGLAAGLAGAAAIGRLEGLGAAAARTTGHWVPVAALADLSQARPTRVVAGNVIAYLFRTGDSVRALSGLCSHPGWPCSLKWAASSSTLDCPCHNVQFAEDGQTTEANYSVPPLPSVPVRVVDGEVQVFSR